MPYSTAWYIENEIVYNYASGILTASEFRENVKNLFELVDSSPRPIVHVMTDVGDVAQALPMKDTIEIVREFGHHPRAGWNIILREKSVLVKMGVAIGTSLFKTRTRSFNMVEEAENFLKEMDSTISWEKVDASVLAF